MPAPLPTPFTKNAYPHADALDPWIDERLQAFSFFVVAILICAAGVRYLWNLARHDWPQLPLLTYRRSLAFTLIWGLVATIVLTMISGARELMTPGAWRKQGWTYKVPVTDSQEPHFRSMRRAAVEQLRVALLQYAALNSGRYPESKADVPADWTIPAHPGFELLYQSGVQPTSAGEILVYEPELGDDERLILLSNGMIGTMRTQEIEAALKSKEPQ
jgi:hypothetical protein